MIATIDQDRAGHPRTRWPDSWLKGEARDRRPWLWATLVYRLTRPRPAGLDFKRVDLRGKR